MIAVPGDTPISPLTLVPTLLTLVTVEPARIPKVQAAPNGVGGAVEGGVGVMTSIVGTRCQAQREVVNVHVKSAARELPKCQPPRC